MKLIFCLLLLVSLSLQDSYDLGIGKVTIALSNIADCIMDQYLDTCTFNENYPKSCNITDGTIPDWLNFNDCLFAPIDSDYKLLKVIFNLGNPFIQPNGVIVVNQKTNSLYLIFHGTKTGTDLDYDNNFNETIYADTTCFKFQCQVHRGFNWLYQNITTTINTFLKPLYNKDYTLYITGHSLGGALSTLAMADLHCHVLSEFKDVILYNSAPPNVGDDQFRDQFNFVIPKSKTWSLVNSLDPIPLNPPVVGTWFRPVEQRFSYTVNWNATCNSSNNWVIINAPCVDNHDPACVYYYALQNINDVNQDNSCDCTKDPNCILCIKCNAFTKQQLPKGCPIVPNILPCKTGKDDL